MERKRAVMLTAIASLIWGTSFPGVKWGLGYAGNDFLFLWLRFLVASAVTLSIVVAMKKFQLRLLRRPELWAVGGLNTAGFSAQYVGLNYTTASKTALLIDINVVAVAIISYFVFAERLGRRQSVGVAAGLIGVVLLTGEGGVSWSESEFVGDITVFLAGWLWAFFIVMNKKLLTRHNAIELSTGAIVTSMVWLLLPLGLVAATGADLTIEPRGWASIVYLGIFCTSIATLLWAMGLQGVSATSSATIMLLEIITAIAISIALLEESLRAVALVGASFVLVAIYLVSSGERRTDLASVTHT
ncbi:MAG: DMT family transporter [Methanobacteriota archaeon]|nr:MAG: DMT family transporter [Euryarchaeota archaeon]